MTSLDEFLTTLGLTDPAHREEIRRQVETYGFELAVAKLGQAGHLTDADKAVIKQVFETGQLSEDILQQLFPDEPRQLILQESIAESLKTVADAARAV